MMSGARTQRFENITLVNNFLANFELVKIDIIHTNLQNSLINQIFAKTSPLLSRETNHRDEIGKGDETY
jgi:hypothetical protein